MTTLTKEEVISQLQTALENQSGKPVSIEQAGSWYKIDGAKSVRFSELDAMHTNLKASSVKKVPLTTTSGLVAEPRRKRIGKNCSEKNTD
jgi:hypothetical protein